MPQNNYLMEDLEESIRLDQKTDPSGCRKTSPMGGDTTGDAGCRPGLRFRENDLSPE